MFAAHPGVIANTFAGGVVVLVHLEQNKYFRLNHSAGVLWESLSKGQDEHSAVAALRAAFQIDEARAERSCRVFVEKALAHGVLVERA